MIYVASLKGINVGGNNIVNMKELKTSFGEYGFQDVITYINSGNIIFTNQKYQQDELPNITTTLILNTFG